MLAAVYRGEGRVALEERERPRPKEDEVLIKVFAASICGTDLKIVRGGHFLVGGNDIRVLGHELAGEIVEVGSHVSYWKPGSRVSVVPNIGCGRCEMCRRGLNNICPDYDAFGITIDGGFQQFMIVPPAALFGGNLFEVPDAMSYEQASLVEPLACCVNAWKDLKVTPTDRVLVMGTGPIAALFLQLSRASGARQVIVVGRRSERLDEIAPHGAMHTVDSSKVDVVDEILRLTGGRGVDVALTCAPARELQGQALACLARLGRMSVFSGLSRGTLAEIDTNKIHYWGLSVSGSSGASISDYARAMRLVEAGQIRVTDLVSHRFGIAHAAAAFDHALSGKGLKTVIYPQQEAV
jgi:L-iditol 2-dehydrogenase